ncbi:hypothetical protein PQR21_34900 [Paraburkholderia nemoris]|uniref:hypothetical protein n=1 Tax=Paraburkholderia nemoris TaxID=2793076 RepID=UPI0038B94D32
MSTTATVCLPKIHEAAKRTVGYVTENPLKNIAVSTSNERTPTGEENRKNPMIGTDAGMLVAYKTGRSRMTRAGGFHVIQAQKESEIRFRKAAVSLSLLAAAIVLAKPKMVSTSDVWAM